jgi:CBS domain-containing protein
VYGALELMAEKNIGAVVVTDEEGKLHGIFSERDFARKMIIKGRNANTTKVMEIMTTLVVSVNPDTRIHECMALMTEKRIRHLPVLDGEKLVGVVSIGDVVKSMLTEQEMVISQQAYKIDQLEQYISLTP